MFEQQGHMNEQYCTVIYIVFKLLNCLNPLFAHFILTKPIFSNALYSTHKLEITDQEQVVWLLGPQMHLGKWLGATIFFVLFWVRK